MITSIIMSDIKLTYFNGRGRAETSRLILAHSGTTRHLHGSPGTTSELSRSEVHRPEAHIRAVHGCQGQASLRPASCGQDQWRSHIPVHGNSEVTGIMSTISLLRSHSPSPGAWLTCAALRGRPTWRRPRPTRLWMQSTTSSTPGSPLCGRQTRSRRPR